MIYDDPVASLNYAKDYLKVAQRVSASEMVSANNQLGIIYYNLGLLDKTIEHFYASMELLDPETDGIQLSRILNNLANVYDELNQNEKALEYYKQSLQKRLILGVDTTQLSSIIGNIGLSYMKQDYLDSANVFLQKSHEIDLKNQDTIGLVYSEASLAQLYQRKGQYDRAEQHFLKVEELTKKLGRSYSRCENLMNMGSMYAEKGEEDKAYSYLVQSNKIAKDHDFINLAALNLEELAKVASKLGRYQEAYLYSMEFASLKDSIFSSETRRQLESAEVQQKDQEITLLTQKAEIDALRLQQNRIVQYVLIGLIFFAIVIAIIYYQKHSYKVKTLRLVREQRNEIAEKNKDILDSIAYARGIQEAMFPTEDELKSLFKESFVFYKPSDVVTGDFYWLSKSKDSVILAVIDCTGHGVPGAFMTVMANSILNNIVNERGITDPARILKELHVSIINTWHKNEDSALYSNGLDAAICHIDFKTKQLTYSGAKRPLYHVRNSELTSFKGNCFSVGVPYYQTEIHYDKKVIAIEPDDMLYMFTDGIVDQFGGKDNKKFLGKRLKILIDRVNLEDFQVQHIEINNELQNWMSGNEQVDDMLLLGVKI